MSQGFQSNLVHCIVAVAEKSPEIPFANAAGLYSFLSDAAEESGAKQIVAGGSSDHVHILLAVPPTSTLSTVIEQIKTITQRWVQNTFPDCRTFNWEKQSTTFSVGMSQVRETVAYIERQTECHRKIDYREELALFGEAYELGSVQGPTSGD
jgi:REP-associated tyrosine transposase